MHYCPFCGISASSQTIHANNLPANKIRELTQKKEYDEIAKYALAGNVFAEYEYITCKNFDGEKIKQEAKKNNTVAMAMLGIRHYIMFQPQQGRNLNNSELYEEAVRMVQKAAELKDPMALDFVANWYDSGEVKSIPKNELHAYRYTQEAANLEYPTAMFRLGKWHLEGTHGVSKSLELGNELIEKAAYYGIPAAMDMLKGKDKTWFETDLKFDDDKDAQELSVKFLMPFNQKYKDNVKYEDDIISVDELLDFDFEIRYNWNTGIRYKRERNNTLEVVSDCGSLNECIEAWTILKKTKFDVYDATLDIKKLCKKICEKAEINLEDFECFIEQYNKKHKETTEENKSDIKGNNSEHNKDEIEIKKNDSEAKKSQIISDNVIVENGQIIVKSLYGLPFPLKPKITRLFPLKPEITTLEGHWYNGVILECDYLDNIRYSFYIPPKEDVYFISLTDGSRFNKRACGYAIASTGIYFKSTKEKRPIVITWNNYIKANIYMGDYSKKTKENMLMINSHAFLFRFSSSELDFLLKLKEMISFVNEPSEEPL